MAAEVAAGSSGSCGTKITCKPGEKAKCEMMNGSTTVFHQASYLNLSVKSDLFLRDLYAYKVGNINTVDCYYSQNEYPENWLVFKTSDIHSVIPRDSSEWVKRYDVLFCDPDLNSCLLYILY
jgi:hypothetical protein